MRYLGAFVHGDLSVSEHCVRFSLRLRNVVVLLLSSDSKGAVYILYNNLGGKYSDIMISPVRRTDIDVSTIIHAICDDEKYQDAQPQRG